MNEENINIIETILFNILSTLNILLVATCDGVKDKEDKKNFLKIAQDTHNLLVNINNSKQHRKTYKSCFGCKYHDLNHIATMCRLDLNPDNQKFACRFKVESEAEQ